MRTERTHRTSLTAGAIRTQIGTYALVALDARNAGSGALGSRASAPFCAALDRTRQALIRRSVRVSGIRLKSHACFWCRFAFPPAVPPRRVGRRISKEAG